MSSNDLYLHKVIGGGDVVVIGTPDVPEYYEPWVRPTSWPANPISENTQITMLFEVFPDGNNLISFVCAGGYIVNWGDGTSDILSSNDTAQHAYDYNDLTEITPDNGGTKVVKITITPASEETLTKLDLSVAPSDLQGYDDIYSQIVELVVNAPDLILLKFDDRFSAGAYSFRGFKNLLIGDTSLTNTASAEDNVGWSLYLGFRNNLRKISFVGDVSSFVNLKNFCSYKEYLESFTSVNPFVNVTTAEGMFDYCPRLTEVEIDFSPSLTNVTQMFNSCYSLPSVPLFETSGVTTFSRTFGGCYKLTSVPLFDMSSNTSLYETFVECNSLTEIPQFNTSLVTNMSNTFNGCYKITSCPLLDTSNVTEFRQTFANCSRLVNVPLFDTSNATRMDSMFNRCESLTSVPTFNTQNVTNMNYMFSDCYFLEQIPVFDMSNVTDTSSMFNNCYSITEIPAGFDLSNVVEMTYMFATCTNLTYIDTLDLSSAEYINNIFSSCSKLIAVDTIITSPTLIDCSNMFEYCSELTYAPVFDTSNVIAMSGMFSRCYKLKTIPAYDVSSVQYGAWNYPFEYIQPTQINTTGMKYSFSLETCRNLSTSALITVFNNLQSVSSGEELRVYGNIGTAGLTETDIEIATNKGWLVYTST